MANRAAGDETATERRGAAKASGKRLANAKVKAAKTDDAKHAKATASKTGDGKSAKGKAGGAGKEQSHLVRNVVISVFAVVMALSMMLPSFVTIFSNNNQNQTAEAEAAAAAAADNEQESEESGEEKKEGVELIDDNYTTTITPLEDKLKENPKDLATLLNLGNNYMGWAETVNSWMSSNYNADTYEDNQKHRDELYQQAMDYFDQYLKLNDSNAVRVNRAYCQLSMGKTEDAQAALEQLTKDQPDYGLGWAYLGLVYETAGDMDKATEVYKKAAEVDANDEYGAKSLADRRLTYMNMDEVTNPMDDFKPTDTATGLASELSEDRV